MNLRIFSLPGTRRREDAKVDPPRTGLCESRRSFFVSGLRVFASLWFWRKRTAAAIICGLPIALLLVWWTASYLVPLPEELLHPADRTLTLVDRAGREIAIVPTGRAREAESVPLAAMGDWLPRVTVALEDRRFWDHGGVDLRAWAGALWRDVASARIVSGGSTIAQQLIKNTRPRTTHRWLDKLYEALAAQRLARTWTKARILEEYLNRIDYGNRRIGPRAAARAYFDKEPAALSAAEAVFLAGLPQSPTRFNPWSHPDAAAARYQRAVRALAAQGVLDAALTRAIAFAPPEVSRRRLPNEAPHFVDAIVARTPHLGGRVSTTLDLPLQRVVDNLIQHHLAQLAGRGVSEAAVVVLDNRDGAVRALVGSANYLAPEGQLDGALLPRNAGSVLKPFLYADAIDRRVLTAASILPDTPDAIRGAYVDYDPQNFDQRFLGPVRVREALGNSLNVPAVYALSRVGARTFFADLASWGFRFPRDLHEYGAGLILGNAEPRLIDVAAAFAGLASGGRVPEWRLLESDPRTGRIVASSEAAAIVVDLLCDDDARRRSFGRDSALATAARVPVKTGTSSAFRDAWTVGATAQHTVAVWAGNFNGRPMAAATSIEAAAPLWRAVIDELLRTDDGVPAPQVSDRLAARDVCRLTGRIPTAASPGTVREWFLAGTEPTETADVWLRPDANGGPTLVLPPEYRAWCASPHNFLGAVVPPPATLAICTPREGSAFALDPALPLAQQMLGLDAIAPPGRDLTWTVDGKKVEPLSGVWLWPLQPGEHVAEAHAGELNASTRFRVEGMQ